MSIQLRLRILLGALFGALLMISFGSALQFRELALLAAERIGPNAQLLAAAAELQRVLGADERGEEFEQAFREQLERIDAVDKTDAEQQAAEAIAAAFEQLAQQRSSSVYALGDELALVQTVAAFTSAVEHEATRSADDAVTRASTAAIGLVVLGVIGLGVSASAFRNLRRGFLHRLTDLDRAARDIQQGDATRRVALDGDDELAHIARALNFALDLRERSDAQMRGRNREIRAVLVALLRQWSGPVAITGIDGEVIASTLSAADEARLRSLTPQLRKAASTLLSRGFASAAELATDVSFAEGGVVHIRALALGEQRIVGWLTHSAPERREDK